MTYRVIFSREAQDDLERLFEFALERELRSETGDLSIPERAIQSIRDACLILTMSPFSCRKAGLSGLVRELIIPFGHDGYVALFEVIDDRTVLIGAVRHQREDDYH